MEFGIDLSSVSRSLGLGPTARIDQAQARVSQSKLDCAPLVTWLLPVLNGMPHLRKTLASIAQQTYNNHRILAWDNGSSDGSQDELRSWIPGRIDGRVVTDRPLMLGACRAKLVFEAQSELLACIDADDVNHPSRLEAQVPLIFGNDALVAIGSVPEFIDEDDRPLPKWFYPLKDRDIRWRTRWQCSFNASTVMFKRSAVLAAGNYRELAIGEDLDLWIRLSKIGRFENQSAELVKYRRHSRNTTAHIHDYFSDEQQITNRHLGAIFPSLSTEEASELWEASYPRKTIGTCKIHHFRQLAQSAVDFARAVGEQDDYFTSSSYYRLQRRVMLFKMLRRMRYV